MSVEWINDALVDNATLAQQPTFICSNSTMPLQNIYVDAGTPVVGPVYWSNVLKEVQDLKKDMAALMHEVVEVQRELAGLRSMYMTMPGIETDLERCAKRLKLSAALVNHLGAQPVESDPFVAKKSWAKYALALEQYHTDLTEFQHAILGEQNNIIDRLNDSVMEVDDGTETAPLAETGAGVLRTEETAGNGG